MLTIAHEMTIAHEIPGRLRLSAPFLKAANAQSNALVAYTRALPGVIDVQVRHVTGSLIILHDSAAGTRAAILRSLALPASHRTRTPDLRLIEAVVDTAVQKLLNHAVQRVVAAVL
jgi:hypothetical protein